MATRMQQRRGTAAQWTAANPILAAGEIGFETDTSKFKMGNGSSAWSALTYFANAAELAAIIDGAPDLLNTLNELAASIGDDPSFFTSVATNLSSHEADTTSVHGIANTTVLVTSSQLSDSSTTAQTNAQTFATNAIGAHAADTSDVHGIADTTALALTADLTAHSNDSTDIHGITNTANLVYTADLTGHNSDTTDVHGIADTAALALTADLTAHNSDTSEVHGIADTAALATKTYADNAVTTHNDDTSNVHGITNSANLVYTVDLSDHTGATTNVHGIADTSDLVTTQMLADGTTPSSLGYADLAGYGLTYDAANDALDVDYEVFATRTYADGAVTAHNSLTTNIHGIADTSLLATTADVAAVTKTTLGLGNVDNTADTAKPVSTAQSSAIATAKAEAIADATSQVNALLTGAPEALNTLDELAAALGDDANFAASVTTSLGLKVDSLTPISQKTASYTLSSLTERDDLIEMGSGSALTLTIPTDATLDFPIGTSIDILQTGAGQVTIAPVSGTVTVNATPGLKLRTTWSSCTLFKRAANTWVVYGDLTA
jgi:hypothetical protein